MDSINIFVVYLNVIALFDFYLQHFYSGSCQQEINVSGFPDMFLILGERQGWIEIHLSIFKINQPHDSISSPYAVMSAHFFFSVIFMSL